MPETIIASADLGPKIATLTCLVRETPAVVVNTRACSDTRLRTEAAWSLASAGLDAGTIIGALNGVRR